MLSILALPVTVEAAAVAAIASLGLDRDDCGTDPFDTLGPWSHWTPAKRIIHLDDAGRQIEVTMMRLSQSRWKASVSGGDEAETVEIECSLEQAREGRFAVDFDGTVEKAHCVVVGNAITVFMSDRTRVFGLPDEAKAADESEVQGNRIYAPMPGVVKSITAVAGTPVKRGTPLIVMEAMKMEMTLTAPGDGLIEEIAVNEGDQVSEGDVLILLGGDTEE